MLGVTKCGARERATGSNPAARTWNLGFVIRVQVSYFWIQWVQGLKFGESCALPYHIPDPEIAKSCESESHGELSRRTNLPERLASRVWAEKMQKALPRS